MANPVSMPSHVHPPLSMEEEGRRWKTIEMIHISTVCACDSQCVSSRLAMHVLCNSNMHGKIPTRHEHACIVIELAWSLAKVQRFAMKSAWESSRDPEQDTKTETETERLESHDKIPLCACPILLFLSIHSFPYHQTLLSPFFWKEAKTFPKATDSYYLACEIKPSASC